jgi:hypothetical protein
MKQITINLIVDGKNKKSFITYLSKHPELRLWQALRNWSKYYKIWAEKEENAEIEDTFYFD